MWKLTIEDDEGKQTALPLAHDEYGLGRGDENSIRLTDRNVSRRHARLGKNGEAWIIRDVQSYNGTYVNGMRLAANQPYPVWPGTQIAVGATVLTLVIDAAVSMAELAGKELAERYVLQECLHSSPKGALYRAQRKGTQLAVAVKLLAPMYFQWAEYRKSFAAEVAIATGLQHPHICRLEDHGQVVLTLEDREEAVAFLVYPLMPGGNLGERLLRLRPLLVVQ